jgi:hypothetical protein
MGAGGLLVQGPKPVHRFISANINPAWQDSMTGTWFRLDLRSGFSSDLFLWGLTLLPEIPRYAGLPAGHGRVPGLG